MHTEPPKMLSPLFRQCNIPAGARQLSLDGISCLGSMQPTDPVTLEVVCGTYVLGTVRSELVVVTIAGQSPEHWSVGFANADQCCLGQ